MSLLNNIPNLPVKTRMRKATALALLLLTAAARAQEPAAATIKEVFFTTDQTRENIDSPAVWHAPDGRHLLFATSKAGHSVNVFDAVNGAMLQRLGGKGVELGQFDRPNGVSVVDDLLMVVERDNRRVQVIHLPSMLPLLTFGEDHLRKPYGLWIRKREAGSYEVYVTDNYETADESIPNDADLGERVHVFELESHGQTAEADWLKAFGATAGPGRLLIVESIYGDPAHDALLLAEELEDDTDGRQVKVYDLNGTFTGKTFGKGIFQAQVEGIALLPTGERSGYWFITDQSKSDNRFHLFDRETFAHLGSFAGERTLNTDGVWLTTAAMPRFPEGAFYACDNDRAISAFDLREALAALGLRP